MYQGVHVLRYYVLRGTVFVHLGVSCRRQLVKLKNSNNNNNKKKKNKTNNNKNNKNKNNSNLQ